MYACLVCVIVHRFTGRRRSALQPVKSQGEREIQYSTPWEYEPTNKQNQRFFSGDPNTRQPGRAFQLPEHLDVYT